MHEIVSSNKCKIQILFFFILILLLRLPALFHPVLDVDEAIYGMFARIWFDGGIPYIDCVETKPLGIYLFFGSIFSIFGRFNMIAVHVATMCVVGATSFIIYRICVLVYGRFNQIGFWAALFYIVFGTTYIPKYIATTIEPIMLLPVCLQFYFWLKFEKDGRKLNAFISGVMFSLACLFKYQAGMNLVVMMLYLGIVRPFFNKNIRYLENWKGFITFMFAAIPLPAIMLFYLWKIEGLDGFWLWNIAGNADYIAGGQTVIHFGHQILTRVLPYIASTLLLWVLIVVWTTRLRVTCGEALIFFWFLLTIVPVSAGFRFYGHYFILLLPPMSVLAARAADRIWSVPKRKWIKGLIIFWIILPVVGFFVARVYMSQVHGAVGEDNVKEYEPLALYIKQNTKPDEKIIAWGYVPLVYWYSERFPGTRFFWSDLLTGRIPGTKGEGSDAFIMPQAWDMFMGDMERNKPVYIVDTAPSNLHDYRDFPVTRYPRLMDYMNKHYREEIRINGTVFYKRID